LGRTITDIIRAGIDALDATVQDGDLVATVEQASAAIANAFRRNQKVLLCGNGGSAAQAQHMAAELSGKFYFDRAPLDAEALHVNSSYLTAVANDYSYDEVFARLVRARGHKGDVLIAISTSGASKNVLKALHAAKEQGMLTIGLCGAQGNGFSVLCDYLVAAPCTDTPRVQEIHMLITHVMCETVEESLFGALRTGVDIPAETT
jgi:D-sedoheptulose 7-phosphate isomerase